MNKEKCTAACNAVLDLLEKDFNIGVGWLEMLNVIAEGCVTAPQAEPQKFDPDAKAKVLGAMYSGVNPIRQDIERLKQDFYATRMFPQFDLISRLIDIVDRLEQRPPSIQFTPMPNPVVFPTLPTIQAPQPWQPYPNYPGGTTICQAQSVKGPNNLASTGQSVGDATGVSEPMLSDEEIPF